MQKKIRRLKTEYYGGSKSQKRHEPFNKFDISNEDETNSPFFILSNYKENDTVLFPDL